MYISQAFEFQGQHRDSCIVYRYLFFLYALSNLHGSIMVSVKYRVCDGHFKPGEGHLSLGQITTHPLQRREGGEGQGEKER